MYGKIAEKLWRTGWSFISITEKLWLCHDFT